MRISSKTESLPSRNIKNQNPPNNLQICKIMRKMRQMAKKCAKLQKAAGKLRNQSPKKYTGGRKNCFHDNIPIPVVARGTSPSPNSSPEVAPKSICQLCEHLNRSAHSPHRGTRPPPGRRPQRAAQGARPARGRPGTRAG